MVQTLATILMTYVQRPSLKQCGIVAKSLVDLHSFLKDDEGDGEVYMCLIVYSHQIILSGHNGLCCFASTVSMQHSWKWFIYHRCQNVNRQSKNEGGPKKRAKLEEQFHAHFYPPVNADDDVSFGRNMELLTAELEKTKPQSEVLKELMCRTFPNRWDAYTCRNDPATLLEFLTQYPLLKKASYVSRKSTIKREYGYSTMGLFIAGYYFL